VSPTTAHAFILSILSHYDIPTDRAALMADALVLADLRGVDTHGINRLGGYLDRVKHKVLNPNPTLTFDMKTPIMAHLDAKNTLGAKTVHI
jgi:LDH2 family malate/lactate/ureidoglycolate dehydrogenase